MVAALKRNTLARRIVLLMVFSSAMLALIASGIQLYLSYQRDVSRVMEDMGTIDTSFRNGLETALWEFNFGQVDALLDGIFARTNVAQLRLESATGQVFERGPQGPQSDTVTRQLEFTFLRGDGVEMPVGTMDVGVSLLNAQNRLWEQFLTLAFSNFVKALVASIVMYLIFDRMVSRNLRLIVQQISSKDWLGSPEEIELPHRRGRNEADEIGLIVSTLNEAGHRVRETHANKLEEDVLEERRLQTEQVSLIRDELETVLNAATSGIVALNSDGDIIRINSRARHMLGGISDETPFAWPGAIRFLNAETLAPLDDSADPISRALNGLSLRGETHLMKRVQPGESRRYVRVDSAKLSTLESGVAVVLVIDDVSNEERHRQVVERKSRLDALGQLTGGIAHDFNNLLAAMLYAVDLARREEVPEKRAAYLNVASQSIDRGRELTTRLLAFAKRQPGRAGSRNVAVLFDDFEKLVLPMIEETISFDIGTEHPGLQVYCDHTQLETALMNLVLNSRDAILRSGRGNLISVRARPVRSPSQDLDDRQGNSAVVVEALIDAEGTAEASTYRYVEISVSDNGPGMDAETLTRATDPFFTTKDTNSGTGLGLSMVYGFARQADGDLRIYSEADVGTTIQLTLPRGTEQGAREEPMPVEAPIRGNGETIFVIEDEQELLVMMTTVLHSLGYIVKTAKSGQEALAKFENGETFDLLLTDIVMPGKLGGFELARLVREKRPDMPVIYTSGYTGFTASEMGAVQAPLLQKPSPPAELADAISKALSTPVVG